MRYDLQQLRVSSPYTQRWRDKFIDVSGDLGRPSANPPTSAFDTRTRSEVISPIGRRGSQDSDLSYGHRGVNRSTSRCLPLTYGQALGIPNPDLPRTSGPIPTPVPPGVSQSGPGPYPGPPTVPSPANPGVSPFGPGSYPEPPAVSSPAPQVPPAGLPGFSVPVMPSPSYAPVPPWTPGTPNRHMATDADMTLARFLHMFPQDMNVKEFKKIDEFPIKHAAESYTNWYSRVVIHAAAHGIFVPPSESLSRYSVHGVWLEQLPETL